MPYTYYAINYIDKNTNKCYTTRVRALNTVDAFKVLRASNKYEVAF